ncbi:MAG TPA: hypothetical protein VLI42_01125 [Chthoniobacterales bacterium]|nr:hypothetical protein [Chthoniobacterales bacterium]
MNQLPTPAALSRAAAGDQVPRQFESWCREAGFQRFEVIHLSGPSSAAIAYK